MRRMCNSKIGVTAVESFLNNLQTGNTAAARPPSQGFFQLRQNGFVGLRVDFHASVITVANKANDAADALHFAEHEEAETHPLHFAKNKVSSGRHSVLRDLQSEIERWSGREDLNLRPLGPEPSALPSCATPRHGIFHFGMRIAVLFYPAIRNPQSALKKWSGREDLNLRPHAPQACALPGCATSRQKSSKRSSKVKINPSTMSRFPLARPGCFAGFPPLPPAEIHSRCGPAS